MNEILSFPIYNQLLKLEMPLFIKLFNIFLLSYAIFGFFSPIF